MQSKGEAKRIILMFLNHQRERAHKLFKIPDWRTSIKKYLCSVPMNESHVKCAAKDFFYAFEHCLSNLKVNKVSNFVLNSMVVLTKIWPYERKCFEYNKRLCIIHTYTCVYIYTWNTLSV